MLRIHTKYVVLQNFNIIQFVDTLPSHVCYNIIASNASILEKHGWETTLAMASSIHS